MSMQYIAFIFHVEKINVWRCVYVHERVRTASSSFFSALSPSLSFFPSDFFSILFFSLSLCLSQSMTGWPSKAADCTYNVSFCSDNVLDDGLDKKTKSWSNQWAFNLSSMLRLFNRCLDYQRMLTLILSCMHLLLFQWQRWKYHVSNLFHNTASRQSVARHRQRLLVTAAGLQARSIVIQTWDVSTANVLRCQSGE